MRQRVLSFVVPSIASLGLLAGCSEEFGAEHFKTTRVVGKVRIGSNPVRGGFIEFLPTDGTTGLMRSGPIQPDGSFVVDRVPVGTNAIGLYGGKLPRVLSQHFGSLGTTIRRTGASDSSPPLDIDLLEEEILYQKMIKSIIDHRNR